MPLILLAVDDASLNTCPSVEKVEETAEIQLYEGNRKKEMTREDYARGERVKSLHDLWLKLPDIGTNRGCLALIKMRSVLIQGFLDAWAGAFSDDRADFYWRSLFRLSFGSKYYEHSDLLVKEIREFTDKSVKVSRLNQAINCLFTRDQRPA